MQALVITPRRLSLFSINRVRLSRRERLNVKEEHLELATKALQETLERFTNGGIDRGALVIAMLSLALHNLAIVDGPADLAAALHRFAIQWDLRHADLKPNVNLLPKPPSQDFRY